MVKEKFAVLISFARKYPKYIVASVAVVLVVGIGTAFALNQNSSNKANLEAENTIASTDELSSSEQTSNEPLDSELQSTLCDSDSNHSSGTNSSIGGGSETSKSSAANTSKSTNTQQQQNTTAPTNKQEKITMLSKNYNDPTHGFILETNDWIYIDSKRYSKDLSQSFDFNPIDQYDTDYFRTVANNKIYFAQSRCDSTDGHMYKAIAYCDSIGENAKTVITFIGGPLLFTIYNNRIYYLEYVYAPYPDSTTRKIEIYSTDLEGNDKKLVATISDNFYNGYGSNITVADGYLFFEASPVDKTGSIIIFSLDDFSHSIITPSFSTTSHLPPIFAKDNYIYYSNKNKLYRIKYDGSEETVFADFSSISSDSITFVGNDNGIFIKTGNDIFNVPYSGGTPTVVTDYLKIDKMTSGFLYSKPSIIGTTSNKLILYK